MGRAESRGCGPFRQGRAERVGGEPDACQSARRIMCCKVANALAAADVNANGDVLFQFSNGVNSMVVLRNGTFRQVHDFFRPTPEGEWLLRINAMDLRDDGTVYFLAVNQFDEVVLYQADPVN